MLPPTVSPFQSSGTMLTVDPSANSTGWSAWRSTALGPELVGAGLIHLNDSWRIKTRAERWSEMALQVRRAGRDALGCSPETAVLEWPRIVAVTRGSKGDPNDILMLAGVVGSISHELGLSGCKVRMARPDEWKGQAIKDVTTPRTRAALSTAELARVKLPGAESLSHNVWDAVGIGLWASGRSS